MLFFDTSALVKRYADEQGTEAVEPVDESRRERDRNGLSVAAHART